MNENVLKQLKTVANTIRGLSMDAIEAANSGHPGLPLGCAELGAYLFGVAMNYNPKVPNWINRDRFVLSAGHGSMFLYSLLHLAGYDLSLDELKQFRQIHSKTPGHPEVGETPGVETTTGPLGQGFATAIGMALGNKIMESTFGVEREGLLNSTIYTLAGDGCLMEGISSEASSLAGHLKLNNLIVIYDSNDICLDGDLSECFSEDVGKRYESYGWFVQEIDGHNLSDIDKAVKAAKNNSSRPSLIIAKTIIGKGSPNLQGTSEVHGKAMGADEIALTKQAYGIPVEPHFYVPEDVKTFFKNRQQELEAVEMKWNQVFEKWREKYPKKAQEWEDFQSKNITSHVTDGLKDLAIKPNCATRQSSNAVIQYLYGATPFVIGGSADLSCSDSTYMKDSGHVSSETYGQRNIKYGVREFAMGAIATGLALQGMILPFCGTFLMFSDYMRNAIRLAALMGVHVIYQFTHDSVFLGEDGPTHQPVEHLASLRAIPHLTVLRPADVKEVKGAWHVALTQKGPVALILTRQSLPDLELSSFEEVKKGGYIVHKETGNRLDYTLIATGSEVALAIDVAKELEQENKSVRVVSMPSCELFDQMSAEYQIKVLGQATQFVSIEAQSSFGWHKYVGKEGIVISIDQFGMSANINDIKSEFGFTTEKIIQKIHQHNSNTVPA